MVPSATERKRGLREGERKEGRGQERREQL